MSLSRCPACGRTVDGRECFACGSPVGAEPPRPDAPPLSPSAQPPPRPPPQPKPPRREHYPPEGDAGRVPTTTQMLTPPSASSTRREGALRHVLASRWGLPLAALVPFLLVGGLTMSVLGAGQDPMLRRIDGGKAGSVIEELLAVPLSVRAPRQYLWLGHAYARNGATAQAIDAYREAGKRGAADERALAYVLAALDHPFAQQPMEALGEWKSSLLPERLEPLTRAESWHLRHNALKVLEARREISPELLEESAVVDVWKGPDCDRRREGLGRLRKWGRSEDALDAVRSLRERYEENYCIPVAELGEVEQLLSNR